MQDFEEYLAESIAELAGVTQYDFDVDLVLRNDPTYAALPSALDALPHRDYTPNTLHLVRK